METVDATGRIVIALCGKMRSGKDTAADYLKHTFPTAKKLHIAQAVYDTAEVLLGYRLRGKKIDQDRKGPAIRWFLQVIGKWGRRLISKTIWLDKFLKILETKEGVIFVTGVRFPNEVAALQKAGAYVIRIHCADDIRVKRGATGLTDETETALDDVKHCDFDIMNNEEIGKFYTKLDLCGIIINSDLRALRRAKELKNPADAVLAALNVHSRVASRREEFRPL